MFLIDAFAMVSVGDKVRKYRKIKGLSIDGLARQTGLSSNYLGALERGRPAKINPTIDTLFIIAKSLGVDVAKLIPNFGYYDKIEPVQDYDDKAKECFEIWNKLNPEQQKIVLSVAKSYLKK